MTKLVQSTWTELAHSPSKTPTFKMGFKEEKPALIHVIQAKEELVVVDTSMCRKVVGLGR